MATLTILVPDTSQSSISINTTGPSSVIPPSTLESGQTSTIWAKHVDPKTTVKVHRPKATKRRRTPSPDSDRAADNEEKLKKFRVIIIIWVACAVLAFLGCIRASTIYQRYENETDDLSQCLTASPHRARVVVEIRDWGIVCAIATVLHSITFIVFQYFYVVHGIGHKQYEPLSQTISSSRQCCNVCLTGGVWVVSAVGILALITWPMTVIGLMIHADNGLSRKCAPINRECWTIISLLIPSIVDFVWIMSSIANDARLDGSAAKGAGDDDV